jgi:hypothetical protein
MRKAVVGVALAALVIVAFAAPGVARLEREDMTTRAVLNRAQAERAIDEAQATLLKAYSIYAPEMLSEEYQGGMIDKSGSPAVEEIWRALDELPEPVASEIRALRARPVCAEYIDTEHFRIHYDTSGTNVIYGWPSTVYRDAIALAAEYCWDMELGTYGFNQPPSDENDGDGGGGSAHYDIYVQALTGVYGYCQGSYYVPGTPLNDATSFVVIDNDYTGFGYSDRTLPMKVTVAHEFNHACQYAHDVDEPTWYKECTAVWIEDEIYDDINDYRQYLSSWFNSPHQSLEFEDVSGLRIYGSCVWNMFLTEYVDPMIVPEIWVECESSGTTYSRMNIVLNRYGIDLAEAFRVFGIWNWFTASRDDRNHYEEGQYFQMVPNTMTYGMFPISGGTPFASRLPDHMGTNYVAFNNPAAGYSALQIDYDGPAIISVPHDVYVTTKLTNGDTEEYGEIPLNPWGNGEITVNGWDGMSQAVLIVSNNTTTVNDMVYVYDVDQVDTGVPDETHVFGLKPASPNPFTQSTSIAYTVPSGGGLVEITVYDVNGREVRTLVAERISAGDGEAVWDGLDNSGNRVASGVYFARLDIDGLTASGKLMVLK